MKKISTFLTGQQIEKMKEIFKKTETKPSEQIRRALDDFFEKIEKREFRKENR